MSHIQSYCCFSSPLLSITRKHHHLSLSSLHLSTNSLTHFLSPPNFTTVYREWRTVLQASSENQSAQFAAAGAGAGDDHRPSQLAPLISASDVVRNFYGGINRHDLASVEELIAQNCVYEDLVFPRPFVGREVEMLFNLSILEFFGKFIDYVSIDLQFVIDDISEEDSSAVGVTWHLDWKGRPFPFSKGCSFYRLEVVNGVRQIIYARDSVEPTIKPGESALIALRGVSWLLQRFPKLVDWL